LLVSSQNRPPYHDSHDYGHYQSHYSYDYEQIRAFIVLPHIHYSDSLSIKARTQVVLGVIETRLADRTYTFTANIIRPPGVP
jgi:hypothetical protein